MELNKDSVDAHRKLMKNPAEHGLPFRPLKECFEKSEEPTPKHILFKEYQSEVPAIQKVFFYIIMDEEYPIGKAASGEFGYFVKFISKK